jgi:hypothetical protein
MKQSIKLTLPVPLKNNNTGQSRHWSASHKDKETYAKALLIYRKPKTPDYKQKVTITRVLGKGERLWDADSVLRGSAKQLIDALTDRGYFKDDGPSYLTEAFGRQDDTQRKNGPAIEVEITEV